MLYIEVEKTLFFIQKINFPETWHYSSLLQLQGKAVLKLFLGAYESTVCCLLDEDLVKEGSIAKNNFDPLYLQLGRFAFMLRLNVLVYVVICSLAGYIMAAIGSMKGRYLIG